MPALRGDFGHLVLDGKLYTLGGWRRGGRNLVTAVERYDPATDTWIELPGLSQPKWQFGAAYYKGRIIVAHMAREAGRDTAIAPWRMLVRWRRRSGYLRIIAQLRLSRFSRFSAHSSGSPMPDSVSLGSNDVCSIARISPRQLQWWDETQIASPPKARHRRVYGREDVIDIMIIAELRRKGVSLQKLRHVARVLRRKLGRRLDEASSSGPNLFLLTDGQHLHLETRPAEVIELLKKSSVAMFLVSVSDQLKRLAEFQQMPGIEARRRGPEEQLALF